MKLQDRIFRHPTFWMLFQKFQKYLYPYLTRRLGTEEVLFFNYGYEETPPMNLPLAESDESDRFSIQLYHRTATQADLSGKRVLEVSSGHGGGASYLTRALRPACYTGLDLNPAGVAFCQKRHKLPGLEFVRGDAEDLPFDDESFDAVINIESSHNYPRLPRFLAEVARVLCVGGHFLYADLRSQSSIAAWEAALDDAPMRLASVRAIESEVLRGMERNSQRFVKAFDRALPAVQFAFLRQITGEPGSLPSDNLQQGGLAYRMYHFVKD